MRCRIVRCCLVVLLGVSVVTSIEAADSSNAGGSSAQANAVSDADVLVEVQPGTDIGGPGNVTMDFKEADIRNVLRILSYKSGVNIVAGDDVQGLVTIRLSDVPWKRALDVILRTYGFAYEQEGNIIRVTTIENLQNEELVTEVFSINYAKAENVLDSITVMLTDRGGARFDERANLLIVTDVPTNIHRIGDVVKRLDQTTPQVLIEARIIETTLDDDENLGIDWTQKITLTGSERPTTFPFDRQDRGGQLYPLGGATTADFPPDSGTAFPLAAAGDFTLGTLDFSAYKLVLEILQSRTHTEVLSNPRIMTLNNRPAKIVVGEILAIPIFERNESTGSIEVTGYEERDVGIVLEVTPHVNPQGDIVLDLHPAITALLTFEELTPEIKAPKYSTREATTQVMIHDGQTVVIGGLIKDTTVEFERQIPLLGDIPLLGYLFKKTENRQDKTDLLFFITVHLVKPTSSAS